ncbi:synemin [Salarias fasciatus]|uniref:IF rod domain-containing protein n=1 Tax=Salarias fasciatus TaxID=181472 RepID=A0A672JF18_SALFA|nr:synemin [Salarias fasciatus]
MLPFKRTFDSEKQQLQQLNSRLAQYLSRTKQLEQENAHLLAEINQLRLVRSADNESKYKAEMRGLRRMVDQLSFEKSQAEMERERLWRELQLVQSLCSEQTEVCRDISGDLKGCEKELNQAHRINGELQQRLLQLQNQYKCLEDAHRQDKAHLLQQVESRAAPIVAQTYRGPPVVSANEVQQYARGLSEGWIHTFEMYQQKVEEMEESIKADQARLSDLQREKMLYASELDKMRTEAEKQGQIQMRLEEQLVHMQEKFRADFGEYQMIIDQLEHERNMMADTIAEKMREHQHLLQVKMDLGMEVAAYRALLEGERVGLQDAPRRVNQQQRERVIDIKLPAQPYTPRASSLTTRQQTDIRYTPPASSLRRSPMPSSGSISPSRVIPISIAERARNQSPASRRDMISFNKARAAASATSAATTTTTTAAAAAAKDKQAGFGEKQKSPNIQKTTIEEKTVKIKQVSEVDSPSKSSTTETKSIRVMSTPITSFSAKTETEGKKQVSDEKEDGNVYEENKVKRNTESAIGPTEKKILDSVSVEEIIEKVIKPAGLEAKACSSGDSKVRYHVKKTEQEDGTTKTQIVLESKVEEELDVSEESALDELLSQGVKKVSLEDIKGTATGSMIQNLLSGLQGGENLQNKSVNVEIIEEPVESHSDEELEVKQESRSAFYEPSTYFQIEELENAPPDTRFERGSNDEALKSLTPDTDQSKSGSVQGQDFSRKSEPSHLYQDQESHEYFVSTPDDNFSEPEEGGGITSYGHYGIVDDLSDERYYQDEAVPQKRVIVEESDDYKFTSGDRLFAKEGFPECIIEEEVRVSPVVQESVLEFLREDSLEPKEQLKGALEKLQSSVSGPLREELAFLTKVSEDSPQKVAVDIKKVQQSSDNGTTTIVAELNVSQTLEDSGLLGAREDLTEEQIMAALRSSNLGLEEAFKGGAGEGYTIRVSTEEVVHGGGFEGFADEGVSGITERGFAFQRDEHGTDAGKSSQHELQSQIMETPVRISHEKRVATVYLDSPSED